MEVDGAEEFMDASAEAAAAPPPPPPPLPALDDEERVSLLFRLLEAPPAEAVVADHPATTLDLDIAAQLQKVLAMSHNKPLARNSFRWLGAMQTRAQNSADTNLHTAATAARSMIEAVYRVIVQEVDSTVYQQQHLGQPGREMLTRALLRAGVGARVEPFPPYTAVRCVASVECVYSAANPHGPALTAPNGTTGFQVIRSASDGRTYALVQKIKNAIYGRVEFGMICEPLPSASDGAADGASGGGGGGLMSFMRGTLGSGAANHCRLIMTDRRVAIKVMSKDRIKQMQKHNQLNENPLKEVAGMQYLTSRMNGSVDAPALRGDVRGVLPIIECLEDEQFIYSVMPVLESEMFSVVEKHSADQHGGYTEPEAFLYCEQILNGLEVLHSLGLAHHDMSLENLMLDALGNCVIIDMGMIVKCALRPDGRAVKVAPSRGWPCRCGKMLYMAPETFEPSCSFDPLALDMWAVGVMMFILLTGVPPWDTETGPSPADQRFALVRDGQLQTLLNAWQIVLTPSAVNFLQCLLTADPELRATIATARQHPWFQLRGGAPAAEPDEPA